VPPNDHIKGEIYIVKLIFANDGFRPGQAEIEQASLRGAPHPEASYLLQKLQVDNLFEMSAHSSGP